nr:hypothetical protein [Gammaproteobacteria bacterium]
PVEGTFATNRYYRFDITRTFTDNRTDTLTSSPNPLYLPPKVTGVTTELTADRTGAFISWTNPASSEALQEIIITRNEFDSPALNSDDILSTASTRHRDLSAVLSTSVAGGMDANVTINNVFAADRYYTFSVTPVYVGSAVGAASPPSPRQYFPPADAILDLTATLNPDRTSVTLTWTNPQSIAEITGINIRMPEFTDSNTNSQVGERLTSATDFLGDAAPEAIRQGNARFTITSSLLDPALYYTFIVVPIYDGDVVGRASEPTTNRIQAELDLDNVTPIVADDERSVVLLYENPPGVASINITILSYDAETGGSLISSSSVTDSSTEATKGVQPRATINGLESGVFYDFTITRTFAAGSSGTATATTPLRTILAPGVSNVQAVFDPVEAMVTLSWVNPENVKGLTIINQAYTDASAGTAVGDIILSVSSEASDIMPGPVSRNLTLTIDYGRFYTFTVTPMYVASVIGMTSEPTTPLQLIPSDEDADTVFDINDVDDDGDGLIEIRTPAEFDMLRNNLAGTGLSAILATQGDSTGCPTPDGCNGYELMNDISLASYSSWVPIGATPTSPFIATFEGNDNTISDLTISIINTVGGASKPNQGLFGVVNANARVLNVHLVGVSVISPTVGVYPAHVRSDNTGALVGQAQGASMIINSSASGSAIEGGGNVGGLIGLAPNAIIRGSHATFDRVAGNIGNNVGGLVGDGEGAPIGVQITSSSATIDNLNIINDSGDLIGGLVGRATNARIKDSVARVQTIRARDGIGGLVGSAADANIVGSVATVQTLTGRQWVGGLIGSGITATVTSSVAIAQSMSASGAAGGAGGFAGGLVGFATNANIVGSMALAQSITGAIATGGLIGHGDGAVVTASAAIADVINSTGHTAGGLFGFAHNARVNRSYASTKTVTSGNGDRTVLGGLIGNYALTTTMVTSSYWDSTVLTTPDERTFGAGVIGAGSVLLASTNTFGGIFVGWGNAYINHATGALEILNSNPGSAAHTQLWNLSGISAQYPLLNGLPISLAEQNTAIIEVLAGRSPVPSL